MRVSIASMVAVQSGEEARLQARIAAAAGTMGLDTLRLTAAVVDTVAKEESRIQPRRIRP